MLTRYLLPLASVLMLVFATYQMTKAQQQPPLVVPPVEPAKSPYATQVAGAGIVEPESENIAIGSHVPGIVDRVFVKVGQTVRTGQPLFRLDDRQLHSELEIREANVSNVTAMLEKLNQMPRAEELPPIEAKVAEAEVMLKEQVKLYDRYRKLSTSNAISEDEIIRREAGLDAAKAQLLKAKAELKLQESGSWRYDKEIANASVRQSVAQREQTRTELDRLIASAPRVRDIDPIAAVAGSATVVENSEFEVLQVNVRSGEFVGATAGPALIVLGQVGKLHVRVDIDENDIAKFQSGYAGVAKPRGNPNQQFTLKFVRVEPYVIPKRSLTGGNTERVDTRVLQVIYAIETKGQTLYVGQQMDVFLDAMAK